MTRSEAIKRINEYRNTPDFQPYRYINEALDMAIKALKKQIPKKPVNNKHTVSISSTAVKIVDWWKCGKCNGDLSKQFACCPFCQTVIDWSNEE